MKPPDDNREYARVPVRQRCWCECGSVTVYAELDNLSEDGAFVRTFAPLQPGSQAELRWALPGAAGDIQAVAEVVWSRPKTDGGDDPPAGMGVRFSEIDQDARGQIRTFVAGLLEEPSG